MRITFLTWIELLGNKKYTLVFTDFEIKVVLPSILSVGNKAQCY